MRYLAVLVPVAALITVGAVMLGLGSVFLSVGTTGTIIIGVAIVIAIPAVGVLVANRQPKHKDQNS